MKKQENQKRLLSREDLENILQTSELTLLQETIGLRFYIRRVKCSKCGKEWNCLAHETACESCKQPLCLDCLMKSSDFTQAQRKWMIARAMCYKLIPRERKAIYVL